MSKEVNDSSGRFSDSPGMTAANIMAVKHTRNTGSTDHIKKGYLFFLLMTVSIGTIQFGYSIGSWNTGFGPYKAK
jgi:hypothetical protein